MAPTTRSTSEVVYDMEMAYQNLGDAQTELSSGFAREFVSLKHTMKELMESHEFYLSEVRHSASVLDATNLQGLKAGRELVKE
ncbi:hypothetical protein FRC04_008032 [Tulasnella sp. 424]|nr:hypothetical protein FRC04_008032 [Tulasnella sp. 424]KAG8959352.1 hypothetical protein FRC05_007900 [Tulasnella sp. 425]